MGGATARLFTFLSSPLPLLHPRPLPSSFFLLRAATRHSSFFLSSPLSLSPIHSPFFPPLKCRHCFHNAQAQSLREGTLIVESNRVSDSCAGFPEWLDFVNRVSSSGYCNEVVDRDEFSGVEELNDEFLKVANGCLAFARDHPNLLWSLSREDIEVVVENDPPFLFKNASSARRRMKSFLGSGMNDVLETDKPSTVDLMRFLLSYAWASIVSSDNMHIHSRVEACVRKLFGELANSRYVQAPRSSIRNIEMKRGDWICPRCSFMNFAKNSKCLECEEIRPKKFLTGREWECPQCDFFNFSRNVVCLRCDCKKPGTNPSQSPTAFSDNLGPNNSSVKVNREKDQPWFTKITQLEKSSDMNILEADQEFLGSRTRNLSIDGNLDDKDLQTTGVNESFHVKISQSLDKMLGEKSNENPSSQMRDEESGQDEKSERWFKRVAELHDVKDLPSAISDEDFPEIMPMRKGENRFVVSKKKDRSLTSPMYKRRVAMEQATNSNYVPFVPFPPGYFAKDKPLEGLDARTLLSNNNDTIENQQTNAMSSNSRVTRAIKEDRATSSVHEASNNVDETRKSFDSQCRSSSSDGYSKVESTSPVYKASNNMDRTPKSLDGYSSKVSSINPNYEASKNVNRSPKSFDSQFTTSSLDGCSTETSNNVDRTPKSFDSQFKSSSLDGYAPKVSAINPDYETSNNVNRTPKSFDSKFINSSPDGYLQGNSSESNDDQSVRGSWRGKSLEGSAVKEVDPLDMSEEAKAERWFRRVAQIKDISELSEIPDEDFPSIMPMRKGVNRFVVSKRKTPLERRLTSSKYRRNLPVVSSEPMNKETDSS